NAFAGHLGDALDENLLDGGFAGGGFVFEAEDFVAGRDFAHGCGFGPEEGIHQTEVEPRGLLHAFDDVGVVAGVDAGELNLDATVTDGADDRFGDAEAVDAVADDLDG